MSKLTHIILHCTDTPEGREVTKGDLEEWHLAPNDLYNGKVRYRGKTYNSRKELPNDYLNGKEISKLYGRGWSQLGYSGVWHLDGELEVLIPWNDDDEIDPWEISNGARGWNHRARHLVYAGGGNNVDTRTALQESDMRTTLLLLIYDNPDLLIIGHNQVSSKYCPSFNVPEWCRTVGIPARNIDLNQHV